MSLPLQETRDNEGLCKEAAAYAIEEAVWSALILGTETLLKHAGHHKP